MHPTIFAAFDRICAARGVCGRVLEIGAMPAADTLLNLPSLAGCARTGINLDGPHSWNGVEILRGDSGAMSMFADRGFDAILCNSVLEHDRRFWRTLAEIRRVGRPGAVVVIGVPGFDEQPRNVARAALAVLARLPLPGATVRWIDALRASTPTLLIHSHPVDYFRFSRQAMADILLERLDDARIEILMRPPRIIGSGCLPA
jgi:SAM-dependent methyltransferase